MPTVLWAPQNVLGICTAAVFPAEVITQAESYDASRCQYLNTMYADVQEIMVPAKSKKVNVVEESSVPPTSVRPTLLAAVALITRSVPVVIVMLQELHVSNQDVVKKKPVGHLVSSSVQFSVCLQNITSRCISQTPHVSSMQSVSHHEMLYPRFWWTIPGICHQFSRTSPLKAASCLSSYIPCLARGVSGKSRGLVWKALVIICGSQHEQCSPMTYSQDAA
jgi:hypothetical protein